MTNVIVKLMLITNDYLMKNLKIIYFCIKTKKINVDDLNNVSIELSDYIDKVITEYVSFKVQ